MGKRSRNITAAPAEKRGRGRPSTVAERVLVTLPAGTIARLDGVRSDDEDRLDVIRAAIEREIERRG